MDRLRAAASLFSFRPFDPGTEEGRSKERYRRAALGTAAAFAARSVQMITSIVSVPLTFHYLGPERNGLWVVISSTITMFSFADLGIGNGLLNAIAGAHGRGDRTSAAHYVSSAFFALIAVAALVATAFAGCYAFVPWPSVFNVSTAQAAAEAGPSVAVFVASFSVSMPLGVVQRVRMGYQEGFVDSLWTTIGGLAAFVSVLMAIRWQLSLPWLVFAMAGVPAVVQLVNAAVLFTRHYPWLRPSLRLVRRDAVVQVMQTGGYFFVLQIAGSVAFQSDAMILTQMLGATAATLYVIPMKLFQLMPTIVGVASNALWPAYGESIARGDLSWARSALVRSMAVGFALSAASSAFFVMFGQRIIRLWVGVEVVPTYLVLVAMGTWAVILTVSSALAAFLNGAGILRFQAIAAVLMMIANVTFSIALTRRLGLSGVVWGSVLSQVIFILIPMWVYLRRWFSRDVPTSEVG